MKDAPKFAGKFKKFRSSGSCGGDHFPGRCLGRPVRKNTERELTNDLVARLRTKAEKFETEADASIDRKIDVLRARGEELRLLAARIRLNDWDDF